MSEPVLMQIDHIYQSIYSALAQADSSFQIWMSLTFAVIVAVHLGADRIEKRTYRLAMLLYGLYSFVAIVKYSAAASQILHYQSLLIARHMEPWPVPAAFGMTIGAGTLAMMVIGSVGTIWFMRSAKTVSQEVDS